MPHTSYNIHGIIFDVKVDYIALKHIALALIPFNIIYINVLENIFKNN